MSRGLKAFALSVLVGLFAQAVSAAEPKPPGEEQIQKWIKQLEDDDFQVREAAEQALIGAGPAAIPSVTRAAEKGDAETQARAKRILEELKLAACPPLTDLSRVLPKDSGLLLDTPGLKAAVNRIRAETALGKLYDHPLLDQLKPALADFFAAEWNMNEEDKPFALKFLDTYGGPAGVAVLKFDERKGNNVQMVTVLNITAPEAAKAFDEYRQRFPVRNYGGGPVVEEKHRGVTIAAPTGEWAYDALARYKNSILRGQGPGGIKALLDQVTSEPGACLADALDFKEAMARVEPKALGRLFFSWERCAKGIPQGPFVQNACTALGFDSWKYAVVSLGLKDGLFREYAFCKTEGERKGLGKLLNFPKCEAKSAALAPPDVLGFVCLPMDGKAVYEEILAIIAGVEPRSAEEFKKEMETWEEKLKIKISETFFAPVKGEVAVWALRPEGAEQAKAPDLCAVCETKDAAAARAVVESAVKFFRSEALGGEEAVEKSEFKGRTCYALKKEALPPDCPYTLAWSADGARVLLAGSPGALRRLLARLEAKDGGLAGAADFQRLLKEIPPEERGALVYANLAALAQWGCVAGIPELKKAAPEELKEKLAGLSPEIAVLFKDLPGTLISFSGCKDGVQARAVGSVPGSVTAPGLPMAMMFLFMMRIRMM